MPRIESEHTDEPVFIKSPKGATDIQYGIFASLLATFMLIAITLIGSRIGDAFGGIPTHLP